MISALTLGPVSSSSAFPVEASGAFTTNALIRGEASGSFYVKDSQVFLDDSENITGANSIKIGKVWIENGTHGEQVSFMHETPGQGTRVYIQPNGQFLTGVKGKEDIFWDDFKADNTAYRVMTFATYDGVNPGDGVNYPGYNGKVLFAAKSAAGTFGIWPAIRFGFNDDNSSGGGVLQLGYHDTSDIWRDTLIEGCWRTGIPVTIGQTILSAFKLYTAASNGTTGSTQPVHTGGTVSDGGVDWTYTWNYQTSAASNLIKPYVLIGNSTDRPWKGLPNNRFWLSQDAAIFNGKLWQFLKNDGTVLHTISATLNGTGMNITNTVNGGSLRFDSSGTLPFMQYNGIAVLHAQKAISDLSATPSIKGTSFALFNNASPTSVTSFTEYASVQELRVTTANSNTTLVHSTSTPGFRLIGGVNRTLTQGEIIQFSINSSGVATQIDGTSGGRQLVKTLTTDYTVLSTDSFIVINHATLGRTMALPAASANSGRRFRFKNTGAATAIVDATSTGQIFTTSLQNSVNLTTGQSLQVISDGTNWLSF